MLAESVSSTPPQTWAAIATAIAGALAVVIKKRFNRRSPSGPVTHGRPGSGHSPPVTHADLDAMRDRVTAGYMAMAEKFDTHQKEILSAIGTQGTAIEKRLDALESTVARLDERTRKS